MLELPEQCDGSGDCVLKRQALGTPPSFPGDRASGFGRWDKHFPGRAANCDL
jgi:hypothetical protein